MRYALRLFLLVVLLLPLACQTTGNKTGDPGQMSFQQARDVVLSMQAVPLAPPPRKMDDILAILDQPEDPHPHIKEIFQRAVQKPPVDRPPEDMHHFYKTRADARYELYRFQAAAADIRQAIAYGKQVWIRDSFLYRRLAKIEMQAGRYDTALDLAGEALQHLPYNDQWRVGPYLGFQSRIYTRMGQFPLAENNIERAYRYWQAVPAAARYSYIVHGGERDIGNESDMLVAEAELLETQGLYAQAYEKRVRVLSYQSQMRRSRPIEAVYAEIDLAANLQHQGRLMEAEKEARWAVKHAARIYGRQSGITAAALQALGEVLLAKGDLDNAKILVAAQKEILERLQLPAEEDGQIRAGMFQAAVLCADYDFSAAMAAYDRALAGMRTNIYLYRRYAHRNAGLILALIEGRRMAAARNLIGETRAANLALNIDNPWQDAELRALEALMLYREAKMSAARTAFDEALPGLMALLHEPGTDFESRRRADLLISRYIDLLLDHYQRESAPAIQAHLVTELFRLADARQSRVNNALGESSARAASLSDPQLAELVRQEQDAAKQIKSLKAAYYNAAAAAGGSHTADLGTLENSIHTLTAARETLLARIAADFPRYADYLKPRPPSIPEIQAKLGATEAFISIWTLATRTCVWAIPASGQTAFALVDLGHAALAEKVGGLRRALKPEAHRLSGIPDFDTATAHDLYATLLAPVDDTWRGAGDLLVVVKGPLDQLPLGVLTTAPFDMPAVEEIRFESYRAVPWLIKQVSLTRLPSAAALLTLRSLPVPDAGREAFIGFGDPVFNPEQLENEERPRGDLARRGHTGTDIKIRGIRISEEGGLDNADLASVGLEQLNRLPDTADEIREIAANLAADPRQDIFLGVAASETNVKNRDLSRKKVLAFATHALLPGDLDGLVQPALAFSSPDVTGHAEDGLLTMGEVLSLKLDADLVVLSACDTGAADQRGSEAVSGLGRAFFYSGARALLVTMWPVETSSAHKLTTGLFKYRSREQAGPSWARALQRSMIALMEDPGLRHPDGSVVARYAHPLFWGAFVVVGDSGNHY